MIKIRDIKQPKFKIIKVENLEDATHWIPIHDKDIELQPVSYEEVGVTLGKKYRLLYDKFEDEYRIVDDNGDISLIYLCHNGELVKMEEVD